jgi:hypothetical protein
MRGEDDSGRGGKWYKFNDDVVLEVPAHEAIDRCYGRRTVSDYSINSAYMLVYVREAEACEVRMN